ncbi:phage tailspike protein [Citrobacter sp. Cf097]|uniref:phage tailspike protein n=1 Tax=Citrobacter sp. Cf097 TaxID=2985059 RepID=UPI00257503E4|nr:phage tailspike protein [Citrobacter sp. Cf097]MDM3203061.1 phage tailspike protein [Citrobacter sp. Cf097]
MSDITTNIVVSMPSQNFTLARSFKANANGKIYIGQIDTDPVNPANQIPVYLENEDGSHVQVAQPLIINAGGYPVYNGQIAKFVTVQGHSMAVYDAFNAQQFYFPNVLKYDPDQLQVKLADPSDGLGDSLVAVKQPGDGTVARTVHDKMAERYTFEDFGAKGDWVTDDTDALNAAALFSQTTGNTIYGCPEKGYKFTSAIQLVNQTTNVPAKFEGSGRTRCFLLPVGSMDAAIKIWGKSFTDAGADAAFGAVFKGFEIRAEHLKGTALDIRRVGLWSEFSDIRITNADGIGMYHESVFDHVYRDIEIRACTGLGIKLYETKGSDPTGFHECSFLEFSNVNVLSCNGRYTQWEIDGGDAFSFYRCKPSEGTVGVDIKGIARGFSFYNTYYDGQLDHTTVENIGIKVASTCFNINVYGGRFWNTKYAIDQGAGGCSIKGINISYNSPTGSVVYHVLARDSISQPIDVDPYMSIKTSNDEPNFFIYRAVDVRQHRYSATVDNANLGAGYAFGAYNQFGNKLRVFVHAEFGTGSSVAGAITVTAPKKASVTSFVSGTLFDASEDKSYTVQGHIKAGEQGMTLTWSGGLVTDLLPFALSAGDMIHLDGEYWTDTVQP